MDNKKKANRIALLLVLALACCFAPGAFAREAADIDAVIAAWEKQYQERWVLPPADGMYSRPKETDLQMTEALRLAVETLLSLKSYSLQVISRLMPDFAFLQTSSMQMVPPGEPCWYITFIDPLPGADRLGFLVVINAETRRVRTLFLTSQSVAPYADVEHPKNEAVDELIEAWRAKYEGESSWAPDTAALESSGWYTLPGEGDLPHETALRIAAETVCSLEGVAPEALRLYRPNVAFMSSGGEKRYWSILLTQQGPEIDSALPDSYGVDIWSPGGNVRMVGIGGNG